jgi:hypothetical protein
MRISTLIAIILLLIIVDDEARYSCEVRMFYICFRCGSNLIAHDPKVEFVFLLVSKPSDAPPMHLIPRETISGIPAFSGL